MHSDADVVSLHRFSDHHRSLLERSVLAGCFYCLAIFPATEVENWIDEPKDAPGDLELGVTALCPRCGIDAVLPDAAPLTLDPDLLARMNEHWFQPSI